LTLQRTVEEIEEALGGQIAEQDDLIAALQRTAEERNTAFGQTEQALTDARDDLSAERLREEQSQNRISELNAEIAALREALDAVTAEAGTDPDRIVVHPETQVELTRLREIETDVSNAQSVYRNFLADVESGIGASTGSAPAANDRVAVLNHRLALNRFLNDEAVRDLFPGMSEELSRYQEAYIETGRENAFLDVTDILVEIAFTETAGERRDLLEEARRSLASQPGTEAVGEFLDELELLVGSLND
ncbi:MAG: hypothetical protein MI724_11180, partial [Spirochaetales bacterium]|nr:hypothetical protein [Spirochaetales bacterium]